MRRTFPKLLVLLLALFSVGVLLAYDRFAALEVEPLTARLHVIRSARIGGNAAVLRTGGGAVVVDSMYFPRLQGERVRREAEKLTGEPVMLLVNTHYHADHTHGNVAFPPGMRIIATRQTREHLLERDADHWEGKAAETLPSETLTQERVVRIGDRALHLIPLRGHTDGDLAVWLPEERVVHAGDLVFRGYYPLLDVDAGGSLAAWIDSLDRLLQLDFERVIPGHGPVTDRAGVEAFRALLAEVHAAVREAARAGMSFEELRSTTRLEHARGLRVLGVPFLFRIDRDRLLRAAWREATQAG